MRRTLARKTAVSARHFWLKHRKKKLLRKQIEALTNRSIELERRLEKNEATAYSARFFSKAGPQRQAVGEKPISGKKFRALSDHLGGYFADWAAEGRMELNRTSQKIQRKEKQLQTLRLFGKKKK